MRTPNEMQARHRRHPDIAEAVGLAHRRPASIPPGSLLGIDVASWQESVRWINWTQVARADYHGARVRFAYVKATEGTGYAWEGHRRNAANARLVGMDAGAYHFARPSAAAGSAAAQAQHFAEHIAPECNLPPVLDLEVTGALPPQHLEGWSSAFCIELERLTGRTPTIYVGAFFPIAGTLPGLPLWLPSYTAGDRPNPDPDLIPSPTLPDDRRRWDIWQFTSSARVAGIVGDVDLNLMTPAHHDTATEENEDPMPLTASEKALLTEAAANAKLAAERSLAAMNQLERTEHPEATQGRPRPHRAILGDVLDAVTGLDLAGMTDAQVEQLADALADKLAARLAN